MSLLCSESPGVKAPGEYLLLAEDLYSGSDLDCRVSTGASFQTVNHTALVLHSFGLTWAFSLTANDEA